MKTWERRTGPYLLQENGKPFTRKKFAEKFAAARDAIPELKGLTLHGLRATAVISHRRAGLSYAQIGDIVGMSAKMVEHYCRNAAMRSNSRAALAHLERASGSGLWAEIRRRNPCRHWCGAAVPNGRYALVWEWADGMASRCPHGKLAPKVATRTASGCALRRTTF